MKDSKVKVDWLGVLVWLIFMPLGTVLGFLIMYKLITSLF